MVDYTLPIEITLVSTQCCSPSSDLLNPVGTLVNDLDLRLDIPALAARLSLPVTIYYTCSTCCDRQGYSIGQYGTGNFDHKNNVERISLPAYAFAANGTQFTLSVQATSLTGDGIDPTGNTRRPGSPSPFGIGIEGYGRCRPFRFRLLGVGPETCGRRPTRSGAPVLHPTGA